jgi:hypothetical protein
MRDGSCSFLVYVPRHLSFHISHTCNDQHLSPLLIYSVSMHNGAYLVLSSTSMCDSAHLSNSHPCLCATAPTSSLFHMSLRNGALSSTSKCDGTHLVHVSSTSMCHTACLVLVSSTSKRAAPASSSHPCDGFCPFLVNARLRRLSFHIPYMFMRNDQHLSLLI